MSKVARIQQPLFDPWLDWNQLPDAIRQQTLDVLTTLYLEITDVPRLYEQPRHNPAGAESTDLDPSALPSMESEADGAPPH
jgi:hypothetical protein